MLDFFHFFFLFLHFWDSASHSFSVFTNTIQMCFACTKHTVYVHLLLSILTTRQHTATHHILMIILLFVFSLPFHCHSIPFSHRRLYASLFHPHSRHYQRTIYPISIHAHADSHLLVQSKWLIVPCAICFATLSQQQKCLLLMLFVLLYTYLVQLSECTQPTGSTHCVRACITLQC